MRLHPLVGRDHVDALASNGVAARSTRWYVSGFRNRDTDSPAECRAPPAVGSTWLVPAMPLSEYATVLHGPMNTEP